MGSNGTLIRHSELKTCMFPIVTQDTIPTPCNKTLYDISKTSQLAHLISKIASQQASSLFLYSV